MTRRRSALKPTFVSPKVAGIAVFGASSRNRTAQRRLYMPAVLERECGSFAARLGPKAIVVARRAATTQIRQDQQRRARDERTDRREAQTARDRLAGDRKSTRPKFSHE